ncbi:MAG: 1-acyl-sn-glycerol-3-phosphate acyltransferase [Treponema sp.]|nr:1-acyl-sn-glycerol-3-phosphate acyltransferase [Treponema sp.]
MLTIFTLIILFGALAFPTLMLTLTYPLSHKWALFWSNYITTRTDRVVFAILRYYRGFRFLGGKDNISDLPKQFLVISNHQSFLDIVVYLLYFGRMGKEVRFVAKDDLNKVPMVGKMLRSQGHCMIPRKGGASIAMKHLEQFGERVMKKNQMPVIFPEGTRSKDGKLKEFYSAGFRRIVQYTHIPVAVCALDGGWKLSKMGDLFTNLKKGAYRVKVLKVYNAPESREDEKSILEEAHSLIENQLEQWRNLPPASLDV